MAGGLIVDSLVRMKWTRNSMKLMLELYRTVWSYGIMKRHPPSLQKQENIIAGDGHDKDGVGLSICLVHHLVVIIKLNIKINY